MESCSVQSLLSPETLEGSAVGNIKRWILVEYRKAWPTRPKLDNLSLDERAKTLVEMALSKEGSRMQLIRHANSTDQGRIFLFEDGLIFIATSQTKQLIPAEMKRYTEPMVLVCTHGLRDRCCGVLGGKIYVQAKEFAPKWVWQSSHLGGHRFAPTLLALPQGMLYGRVSSEDIEPLLGSLEAKVPFSVEKLRGVPAWPQAAQAAASTLWKKRKLPISFQECVERSEDRWHVSLEQKGSIHRFSVSREPLSIEIQVSCGDEKLKSLYRFSCHSLS
jgi:hypothetical protein